MAVGHRDDQDPPLFNPVNNAEWIPPKEVAPSFVIEGWPSLWLRDDGGLGRIDLNTEPDRGRRAPLRVPARRRLGLASSA